MTDRDPTTESLTECPRQALLVYGDSNNLGDEIQSLAVQRLLTDIDAFVERDNLAAFAPADRVQRRVVLNGWYTNAPENWPPSEYLEPLPISMHISGTPAYRSGLRATEVMVSEPLAEYLRHYGPVGARDFSTARLLERTKIDCYFSGCATLTLPRSANARDEESMVLNEVPPAAVAVIKARTRKRITETSHVGFWERDPNDRLRRAGELLDLYRTAGCVVTSRLHCALPCVAMGTPVLLLDVASDQHRFEGLHDLVHHCSVADFLGGKAPFDPEHPPPTLDRHFDLAAGLSYRIRSFVTAPRRHPPLPFPLTDRQRLEGAQHIQRLLVQRVDSGSRRWERVSAAGGRLLEALKKNGDLESGAPMTEERRKDLNEIEQAAAHLAGVLSPDANRRPVVGKVNGENQNPGRDSREPKMPASADEAAAREAVRECVIHVDFPFGNVGNKMLQYMAAVALSRKIGGCRLSGIKIPEWGIDIPVIHQERPRTLRISSAVTKKLDMHEIAQEAWSGAVNRIELNIYSSHIGNMLQPEDYKDCFKDDGTAKGFGADTLLINIRANEVLRAVHREYTVLPVEFYAELLSETKLQPVFIGQLDGASQYITRLRGAFPGAQFISSRGAVSDFNTIRNSRNVVTSISTFSWLAAWLSHADRIFMPLSGFCNPLQYPAVDLLPAKDPRFWFYLFPVNYAVPDEEIEEAHKALIGKWKRVTYDDLQTLLAGKRAVG